MNRILALLASLSVVAATLLNPAAASATQAQKARPAPSAPSSLSTSDRERVPGEVVVRYTASADRSDRVELRNDVDAQSIEPMALARAEVVEVANGTVDEAIAELAGSPEVLFAEPNYYYRAASLPNDPRFDQDWGLHNTGQTISGSSGTVDADIDAPEAWDATTGSHGVLVAIADTGVAYDHPDLAANIWTNPGETTANATDDDRNGFVDDTRGWDFIDDDNTPRDLVGHGTHVAGTVGAVGNNGYGTSGVNWNVSLMPLRVLDSEGSGTTSDVANAIAYAAAKGADVVNLSLGGPDFSLSVSSAISNAPNVLIVAAAGNEGANIDVTPSYPCNYPLANVVCVGATDMQDQLAGYSNYGAANVDLAAPGSRILSTVPAFRTALRETFEADISTTWIAGGTGTPWSRGQDAFGFFATDSAIGNYLPNTDSWLRTATPSDLAGQQNCRVSYAFQLDTESNADAFLVEASSDGTTWTEAGGWTGSTGGDWLTGAHDLTDYDGGSVYLRLRLTSNGLIERGGVSVDDLQIRCLTTSFSGTEFSYYSGTSMATPHVAGAAALVLSGSPTATTSEVRDALLRGVDVLTGLTGKAATSGRLNVAKALGVVVPTQLPSIPPLPTASPSESAGGSASPSPTPTPTPSTSTTPTPAPTVEPTPPADLNHERAVRLSLSGHLRLDGEVIVSDGFSPCISNVQVVVKRNGSVVKRTTTTQAGTFRLRVGDRSGSYRAFVPAVTIDDDRCGWSSSSSRRHRH